MVVCSAMVNVNDTAIYSIPPLIISNKLLFLLPEMNHVSVRSFIPSIPIGSVTIISQQALLSKSLITNVYIYLYMLNIDVRMKYS